MTNTAIVFTAPGIAEIVNEPVMTPGDDQVLVRIAYSTISPGTERANLVGDPNVSIGSRAEDTAMFPRRLGYSSAGTVVAVGRDVKKIRVGDRVALSWTQHAKYYAVPETNVHKLEDGIPFQEAALWHISTFPMAAIRKCRLEVGESAIVMGMGVLGQMAVKLLRCAGAAPVIAVDPVPAKRERALAIGADYAFDPFAPDFAKQVKAVTEGGCKVGIEVTGNGGGLNGILDCMARFGRVALLGCTRHSDFQVDYYRKVHGPGITLIGAHTLARPNGESAPGYWTTHDDVMAVQKLVRLGRLSFREMVEETHPVSDAPAVYARLAREAAFPFVQFDWQDVPD